MWEIVFIMPDGAREYFFHASLQSARSHVLQFRGWSRAEILHHA